MRQSVSRRQFQVLMIQGSGFFIILELCFMNYTFTTHTHTHTHLHTYYLCCIYYIYYI